MKTLPIIALLVVLYSVSAIAQSTFPDISGTTLTGKDITIPKNTKGKYTLVGMAYSKKAEEHLNTWFHPVYSTFIQPTSHSLFPSEEYDVNIYFIPMITGIAQGASGKIEDKMKKNILAELQPYVLLYSGEVKTYKENLNMAEKDEPYFFVLDQDGKIAYSTTGIFTQKKMDKILEIVEESDKF